MGIKRVRQSKLFDLEISRIRERKILRKKKPRGLISESILFLNMNSPEKALSPRETL